MDQDFTVADLLAWARTKPADEPYDVGCASICALGQFGTETDREYLHECFDPDKELDTVGLNDALGFEQPKSVCTFGALVTRLEALCPDTPVTQSDWSRLDAYLTDIELVRESVSQ